MSTTYIVTGRDTGHPLLDLAGTLNGLNIGDTFTTTLSGSLEAKLLGAGLIAHTPVPHAVTSAGTPVIRKFPFAFDTPNLLTGADLYTPTIGDILLDAWVEIVTGWNGTTPLLDIGRWNMDFVSVDGGWWGWFIDLSGGAVIDAGNPDVIDALDSGTTAQRRAGAAAITGLAAAGAYWNATQIASPNYQARQVPARFITADPVSAVVSRTGIPQALRLPTDPSPGSTQGAAVLYLITVTPV